MCDDRNEDTPCKARGDENNVPVAKKRTIRASESHLRKKIRNFLRRTGNCKYERLVGTLRHAKQRRKRRCEY